MLTTKEIMEIIPHRHPFLLVDRIESLEPGISAVGYKAVTYDEPYFAGHFPQEPVMPGVLIVEALAQTSVKRVHVEGLCDLAGLEGIRDLHYEKEGAVFLYSGRMELLLNRLAKSPIRDLTITEPDLEEIFMHYYEKGGEQA